jgi:hypothetical protein
LDFKVRTIFIQTFLLYASSENDPNLQLQWSETCILQAPILLCILCTKCVHEMSAYRADHFYVVALFSLRTSGQMWIKFCMVINAIGVYPKIILLNFLQSVVPAWQMN